MARISTYSTDVNVVAQDKWIGTDSNGSVTKNFTAQSIADFLNNTSAVAIAGQNNFFFQTDLSNGRAQGTISFTSGGGSNTAFASLTTMKISKYANSGYVVLNYLQTLVNQAVFVSQTDNVNNFGIYKLLTLDQDTLEPEFYNATFQLIQSHGALLQNHFYTFSVYPGFISYPFTVPTPTLQSVTTEGNTTTNDIILNSTVGEYGDYTAINTVQDIGLHLEASSPTTPSYIGNYTAFNMYLSSTMMDGSWSEMSLDVDGGSLLYLGTGSTAPNSYGGIELRSNDGSGSPAIAIQNGFGGAVRIRATNLTNDGIILQFPNKANGEYTIATTSDIPVYTTPTLQSVTTAGSATTNPITIYDGLKNSYLYPLGLNLSRTETGVANTLNVNTANGLTMDFNVTGTGHFINSIQIGGFGTYNYDNGNQSTLTADGGLTIRTKSALFSPGTANLKADLLTGNRTYQFPDSAGTLALISQIPSLTGYVPYTGATTNLNLGAYNYYGNSYFNGFTSVVASASLITLTVNSTPVYLVTGSGGQTIKLPVATTLPNGTIFSFNNNQSSGVISVNNNSNTLVKSVPSGAYLTLELIDNTTATGTWDAHFQIPSNAAWSTNTLDWAGSITNATWNGVSIADNRIASSANWNTAYTNRITSLTATGTGAATLVANVLNIPTPPTATFTSLTTTGSSGSSTLTAGVLNIPQYMGATTRKNANNSTNSNINYCGVAVGLGVSESSAVWTITRITIASSGSITTATATNVAWTNRESAIYT